jgi:type I restriction enzyme, S subunit
VSPGCAFFCYNVRVKENPDRKGKSDEDEFLHLLYGQVEWQTENGGTVNRLYNTNIENTVVSVPPLSEQRRIVTALSSLDGLLSSLAAEREKLASLKRGLLRHFFG